MSLWCLKKHVSLCRALKDALSDHYRGAIFWETKPSRAKLSQEGGTKLKWEWVFILFIFSFLQANHQSTCCLVWPVGSISIGDSGNCCWPTGKKKLQYIPFHQTPFHSLLCSLFYCIGILQAPSTYQFVLQTLWFPLETMGEKKSYVTICSVNRNSKRTMQHLPKHQQTSPLRSLWGTDEGSDSVRWRTLC